MAVTCLFVASKVQETVKKCRDIVVAAWPWIRPDGDGGEVDPESDVCP